MSDGIIKLNEEIDQVVEDLDGVAGSYEKGISQPVGSREGVAQPFFDAMSRGREEVQTQFAAIDKTLKQVAEAMKASVKDHRATEAEISDEVLRRLNEIAEAENRSDVSGAAQKEGGASDSGRTKFSGGKF